MKNKTFGSSLMVAGTTIGAGMLATPLTSAEMGFGYTVILLVGLWALLCYSALLFVEVYQKAERHDAGIATLAEQHFGMAGRILASLSLILFMYAILTVYALGGGSLFAPFLAFTGDYAEKIAIVAFVLIFGVIVMIGTSIVDALTRFLFALKVIAFCFVLLMMLPKISMNNLGAMPLQYWLIISASPVFFTSFGFHVIIPSINHYLEGDIRRLRTAILIGTGIPLGVYIIWQMATHGVFSQIQFIEIVSKDPTLNGLVEATYQSTGSQFISSAVRIFSALALVTSFLGVALSLVEALGDLFKRAHIQANRPLLSLLAFAPVLLFALFYNNFLAVLSYAGQMFTFYGLVLPVAMAWQQRKKYPNLSYQVIGGKPLLVVALILGLIIMNVPFLIQWGYLPNVVG